MQRFFSMIALVIGLVCIGLHAPSLADDERLVVVVHPTVPVHTLSEHELASVFTLSRRHWSNGDTIIALNLEAGTPGRTQFDRVVLGMTPAQSARFWIDRRIRQGGTAPPKIPAALMAKVVAALPRSIGYLPESLLSPGARVVARVVHGRVLPEVPARKARER